MLTPSSDPRFPPRSRRAATLPVTLVLSAFLAAGCGDGNPSQPETEDDPCEVQPSIAVGQSVSGDLRSGDCVRALSFEDRFTLTVPAPVVVRIDLRSTAFDALLELWTASGQFLLVNDDTGSTDSRIIATLQPGSYRINATSFAPGETGRYTLSVGESPDCAPVGSLVPGDTLSGVIDSGDCLVHDLPGHWDNWTFAAGSPGRFRFWMSGTGFEEAIMITAPGESEPLWVAFGAYSPTGAATAEVELTPGVWTVAAGAIDESQSGAYRLTAGPAPPCGPGALLSVGTPVSGELSGGDCLFEGAFPADSFGLVLAEERALEISMTSSELVPLLNVIEEGYWAAWADASENGTTVPDTALLRIVLPAGDWPVIAGTYAEPLTGSYELAVRDAVCPLPDTIATGKSFSGALTPDDCLGPRGTLQDRWSITLPAETAVRVDLTSAAFDAFLVLRSSDGTVVAVDDDGGGSLDSRIQQTLSAGTYQIGVQSFSAGEGGAYTLSVSVPSSLAPPSSGAVSGVKTTPRPWLPVGSSRLTLTPKDTR